MPVKIPLSEMTLEEKLAAMEALWDDLARSPDSIESPAWHQPVLDARGQRVASGAGKFEDWEKAKSELRAGPR